MSRINATTFFKDNGLFKLLVQKEGDPSKSYKTAMQNYIMECTKCDNQVEQRGNSKFECRRCRRSVAHEYDEDEDEWSWVISEPEGEAKAKAEKAMLKPAKILVTDESEDESEDDEPVVAVKSKKRGKIPEAVAEIPGDDDMISFLKATAKKTSGARIAAKRKERDEEEAADIDEPVLPAVKAVVKKVPAPKPTPAAEKAECPAVKEVTMKIVELSPGQTYYCKELGIMFVGKA